MKSLLVRGVAWLALVLVQHQAGLAVFAPARTEVAEVATPRPCPGNACPVPTPSGPPVPLKVTTARVQPWESAVRIRVRLSDGESVGSGTIIDGDPARSIIMTCAHLFRDARGHYGAPARFNSPITVDLFDGHLSAAGGVAYRGESYPAACLDFDAARDVAIVTFAPGKPLVASRLVPASWGASRGEAFISVGCSHAADATAWTTTGIGMTRGVSAYRALVCDRPPISGRSGGGLFTAATGRLAAVCNASDGAQGYYAPAESMRRILETNHLAPLAAPPESDSEEEPQLAPAPAPAPAPSPALGRGKRATPVPTPAPAPAPDPAPGPRLSPSFLVDPWRPDAGHYGLGALALAAIGFAARRPMVARLLGSLPVQLKPDAGPARKSADVPMSTYAVPVPEGDPMRSVMARLLAVVEEDARRKRADADRAEVDAKLDAAKDAVFAALRPSSPASPAPAPGSPAA